MTTTLAKTELVQPIYDVLGQVRKQLNDLEIPDNTTAEDCEVANLVYQAQLLLLKARVKMAALHKDLV